MGILCSRREIKFLPCVFRQIVIWFFIPISEADDQACDQDLEKVSSDEDDNADAESFENISSPEHVTNPTGHKLDFENVDSPEEHHVEAHEDLEAVDSPEEGITYLGGQCCEGSKYTTNSSKILEIE